MKPEYETPKFEILGVMPRYDIMDLNVSSGGLGDAEGGGNEDFND